MEKWVLARRRSQLFLRIKAAHADVGSRKGMKKNPNNQCIKTALPTTFPPPKKGREKLKLAGKKRRAGMICCLWLHRESRLWGEVEWEPRWGQEEVCEG